MKRDPTTLPASPETNDLRQRAQERLQELARKGVPRVVGGEAARYADNPQRLLHELEVHQVELAMQNEQLEAARGWVEAALASYTELYDYAPVPYFTLSRSGMVIEVNLAGARLLGIERSQLLDQRLAGFVAASDQRRFAACIECVFAAQADTQCELSLASRDGTSRTVEVRASLAANGTGCRAVLIDVSERSAHERRMTRLADVFSLAREAMFITDCNGVIVDINHAFSAVTGYARTEVVGHHGSVLRCDRDSPGIGEAIMRALAVDGGWSGQVWHRHRDGRAYAVVEQVSTMFDSSGVQHCVSRFSGPDSDVPAPAPRATVH